MRVGVNRIYGLGVSSGALSRCVLQGVAKGVLPSLWSARELSALKRAGNAKSAFPEMQESVLTAFPLKAIARLVMFALDALEFLTSFSYLQPLPFRQVASGVLPSRADAL